MFYNADVFLSSFTKPDTLNTIHPYLNQYSMQSHTQSFICTQIVKLSNKLTKHEKHWLSKNDIYIHVYSEYDKNHDITDI